MKTTLEFPDPVFRKAKARAAERGIPLRQFVTEAVEDKLRIESEKPWMKTIGGLRHLHKENVRIQQIIDEEFEKIDPDEWA
jgi:enolase